MRAFARSSSKLNSLLRTEYDGVSLTELGVKADRNGQLSLDKSRLEKALQSDPAALDKVFGKRQQCPRPPVCWAA